MQHRLASTAVAALVALSSPSEAAKVTPVQKVLELMEGMLEKGKKEKHEEQVQFVAYKQFCDDTSVQKKRAIEEANEMIEVLEADIEKYTTEVARLTKEIAAHDDDIAAWTGDKVATTKVRELEKADYDNLHQDYSESVDALQRAIAVLKKQAYDRAQAEEPAYTRPPREEVTDTITVGPIRRDSRESFVQVAALNKLSLIPESAKKVIDAFLQQAPEGIENFSPEAHGYEFQSNGIIEMLEKLLDKFIDERTSIEKQEMNSEHAYQMLMQDLTASIKQAKLDRTDKAEQKAQNLQSKADAKGDLKDTTDTRDADQKYLNDLTATCEQKASDFESRQQLRAQELEAINKAMEIISSSSVQGNAETHLPSLAQQGGALVALRSSVVSSGQNNAAAYLKRRSRELSSRVLLAVAEKAASDPFNKVKKMIKDLVMRLMEEANEETDHKGWCDTELATNEQTRKQKTVAVETLHAFIDQLEASIAKLSEDITQLSKDVAALDEAMAEATTLRQEEKATNTQTIADAQEAQTAVAQALTVLKEFYAKAGEATAFVQQQPEAPEIFDSSYKGMQSENGGVVGMLEVIESDFARLEADTKAAETSAQKEYDTFMTDSRVDKESKSKDIEHKSAKRQDQEQALTTKHEDLDGTQKELDAALSYYDKLKPSCVDAGESFEDRVARRKEEIESLQQALRILNGEDLA